MMGKHLIALGIFIVLTSGLFLPLISGSNHLIADDSDGLLGAWTIAKVQNNLLAGKPIFEGNTFFPHQDTLLFSDIFVTSAILSLLLRLVSAEPLSLYNVSILASMVFTCFFTYLFLLELLRLNGEEKPGLAFLGAAIFGLSTIHLHYLGHLHMFALQYVIASMWALTCFARTHKSGWLLAATFFVGLQVWQSIFLVYYLVFFIGALLFLRPFRQLIWQKRQAVIMSGGLFLLLCAPVILGLWRFWETFHAVRDIREAIHFSLIFPDLWRKFMSPVAYVFIGAGLLMGIVRRKRIPFVGVMVGLGFFAFVLSLGPALHWGSETVKFSPLGYHLHVPLPYALFYYLAPGFQAFRTPSRFMPLVLLTLTAGSVLLLAREKWLSKFILPLSILGVGISSLLIIPISFVSVPNTHAYPAYINYLHSRRETVLLKLPIRVWSDPLAKEDTYQMLFSLFYQKYLVNGQSGFFPQEWLNWQQEMTVSFPSPASVQLMKQRGVELVLMLKKDYSLPQLVEVRQLMSLIYEDSESEIYKIP